MLDVFLVAQYVVCQRVGAEDVFLEVVVDLVGRCVFVRVYLFKNNIFLFFNLFLRKSGMEDDVGKEFQTSFEVYRERRSVDAGLLFGGECVEFASDAVNTVQYVVCAAVFGAFEYGC